MSRAVVFNGDETWEMRDLPVPDPRPGGAVLRVEATGLCHSDVDHFRGNVHTPWGGEFPSIAGHEIVGRIDKITPEAAAAWGVDEGDRVAVRGIVVTGTAHDRFRLDCARQAGADHVVDVDAEDPIARVRELTDGRMADVVLDAASGDPVTVNLAMDLVKRGGHVVIAGMKDKPLEGFHSDWIPTRQITLHPGAGLDTEGSVALINEGKVPTAALLGETYPLEQFEEAFALMTRQIPGRDAVRVALRLI